MVFEVLMLLCFGLAWPLNIYNSFRGKSTRGKSLLFLSAIDMAYVFGLIYKIFFSYSWSVYFYWINFFMVTMDLVLYFLNRQKEIKTGKASNYYSILY